MLERGRGGRKKSVRVYKTNIHNFHVNVLCFIQKSNSETPVYAKYQGTENTKMSEYGLPLSKCLSIGGKENVQRWI